MAQLDQNPLVVVARYLVIHMVDPLGNRMVFHLTTMYYSLLIRALPDLIIRDNKPCVPRSLGDHSRTNQHRVR